MHQIRCPNCAHKLESGNDLGSETASCPKCDHYFPLPSSALAPNQLSAQAAKPALPEWMGEPSPNPAGCSKGAGKARQTVSKKQPRSTASNIGPAPGIASSQTEQTEDQATKRQRFADMVRWAQDAVASGVGKDAIVRKLLEFRIGRARAEGLVARLIQQRQESKNLSSLALPAPDGESSHTSTPERRDPSLAGRSQELGAGQQPEGRQAGTTNRSARVTDCFVAAGLFVIGVTLTRILFLALQNYGDSLEKHSKHGLAMLVCLMLGTAWGSLYALYSVIISIYSLVVFREEDESPAPKS